MQELQGTDRIDAKGDDPTDKDTKADDAVAEGDTPKAEDAGVAEAKAEAEPAQKGKAKAKPAKKKAAKAESLEGYSPRLKDLYKKDIVPALMSELGLENIMQVPKVTKVLVNIGLGEALENPKAVESAERDLTAITGQHPVTTKAKKSIAAFKIRQGMTIGIVVTMRGYRMYEFLDRLINIALPRIRDFRGAPTHSFDGRGNYSLGLREQVMFPEVDFNEIDRIRGLQINIVTTATTDDAARRLLELMGFAFSREPVGAVA
jgi:large subunit ribosomal protein L5